MTKNTVNETEPMVITRVFDAPRELVWKAWTDPKYVMQWWGPKGFTAPFCEIDFRWGGKFLLSMRTPDGWEGWNAGESYEIVPYEKIVSSMSFSDSKGNKIEPEQLGVELEAIDDAHNVILFEDIGNGQTKPTFIGNETMQNAIKSGQLEGMSRYSIRLLQLLRGWHRRNKMWDDGARGGTACQRTRLDPGIGPVRNRVEGSNPHSGKGVGTIPQAAPAGHRRKNRGRSPA